ncbi:tRNA (adenosine(37)-N6)-threonylcarbamoyltransferase complex ATPase subunit type 1 TsaE [Candidatus Saccharibacteria bacterium]|nr:tRNA (adenosine(37)-N6)-threonylcarbamoyltransferase complex ATPase subunit type 1 TsaE [Candidatus Saccharibacteria bacterium]
MIIEATSEQATRSIGEAIGRTLRGGEVFELVGDVGAGKTTFAKGLAAGLGVSETVQSPSFTISQVYEARDHLRLAHYDFYRLQDPGIMADELNETVHDIKTVTVIEWADTVGDVLPDGYYRIVLEATSDNGRTIIIPDEIGEKL